MILAGDVGGTKTLLALFSLREGRLRAHREGSFPSQDYPSFQAMIDAFLSEGDERVEACAVGVAGPVVDGRSEIVNLRWPIDTRSLRRTLRLDGVHVLNDVEATGWGIPELPRSKIADLTPGLRPGTGNAALIAPGTGLGMSILFWDGERHVPSAGEGGHQAWAPRDGVEIELLRHMQKRIRGRVSIERIVAGPGISAIYRFLVESGRGTETPGMTRRLASGDPNAEISEAGVRGEDETAECAVDLFVSAFGAVAGDFALVSRALAGVWVGGGIAPKILPKLRSGGFLRSFRAKGRLSGVVERIPIRVILEPRTGLLGAAARASGTIRSGRRAKKR